MKFSQKLLAPFLASLFLFGSVLAGTGDFFPNNIPSARTNGITVGTHPQGYPSATRNATPVFNLYRDSYVFARLKGHLPNNGLYFGAARDYLRNNGLMQHADERDFTASALNGGRYFDTVTSIDENDEVKVMVFVHNATPQYCGGSNYAQNVYVDLDFSNPESVVGSIGSSNAIPTLINDISTLGFNEKGLGLNLQTAHVIQRQVPDAYPSNINFTCGAGHNMGTRTTQVTPQVLNDYKVRVNLGTVPGSYGHFRAVIFKFKVEQFVEIKVDKDDSTPGTVDNDGNDSQTVAQGGTATFTVTPTNTGKLPLTNVTLTDPLSPSCDRSSAETLPLIQAVGNRDDFFDPGESFSYTCEDTNVQAGYTNVVNVVGTSVSNIPQFNGVPVTDSDPTVVLVGGSVGPEIKIDKDDSTPGTPDTDGDDTQKVVSGQTANFTIKVTNTGDEDLQNVVIEDQRTPSCARTAAETLPLIQAIGNNDALFNLGESFTYTCTHENVTAAFTNLAKVTGTGVTSGAVVMDEDPTEVVLDDTPPGTCGDGIVQSPEQCDLGALNGTPGAQCTASCTLPGGGGGPIDPSLGTCAVHPNTGAFQCIRKKPVRDTSDPLWDRYRRCRDGDTPPRHSSFGTYSLAHLCALDWAEDQGLALCGATFGGSGIDPFVDPSTYEANIQCGAPINPPHPPSGCVPVGTCPECFRADATISKQVIGNANVAKGERVKYEVTVDNVIFDHPSHQITAGRIKVYDLTIPTESGNIWNRTGIIDGDGNGTWSWNSSENYFEKILDASEIAQLNATGARTFKVHYDMDTALAATKDTSQIANVAFAVIDYHYRDSAGDIHHGIVGVGDNACNPPTIGEYISGTSSLGATATVQIIRPFVRAKAGNVGIQSYRVDKITGAPVTEGEILTDNTLFGADVLTASDFEDFGNYQENKTDFYENAAQNTTTQNVFGDDFKTHDYESGVYFRDGDLDVNSLNLSGLTQSVTFVLDSGNLVIDNDFAIPGDYFVAFVVRNGDILIDKDVSKLEGVFIVETGEVKSKNDEVSETQLRVSGNLMGNLGHILSFRKYIGNSSSALEPSMEINFDLRLLEQTPPILEQFLGENWREEIQ